MLYFLQAFTWRTTGIIPENTWLLITGIMEGNMAVLGTSIKVSKLAAGIMEVPAEASETDTEAWMADAIAAICKFA